MCDKKSVTSQVRMSEFLYTQVKQISDITGDSLNGTILNLIYWGLKDYNSGAIPQTPKQ